MYVCIRGACVHMYKLGQSVYIDVNYVDVHLPARRELRSSRSEYTYRSSLRLGNPSRMISKNEELYLL